MDISLGFIGLGRMGLPMLKNLVAAGYSVYAYDTAPSAVSEAQASGANIETSVSAVADRAQIILACLPSPAILKDVLLGEGGVSGGEAVHTVIDLSTTGPRVAGEIAAGLNDRGIRFVDAPVSGGVAGARKGTLSLMVACPTDLFQTVSPILSCLGTLFHVSQQPGHGQTLKLVNNILNVASMAITSEAIAMGVKAGLSPSIMVDVINVSSGRNTATQDKFPKHVIPRTFDFGYMTGLAYKDVKLCVDEAEALGVPMIVGGAVRQFMNLSNTINGPGSDITRMVAMIEEWTGIVVADNADPLV